MAHLFDVAIIGATPAGFAAAYSLAKGGLDAVVVDVPASSAGCPLADWTGAGFFRLPRMPAGLAKSCRAKPFKTIAYHNAALDDAVQHRSRSVVGYFLRSADLTAALSARARKAGAKVRASKTSPALRLEEDCVLVLGSREIAARLLIVTEGQPVEVLADLGIMTRMARTLPLVVAGLDLPWTGRGDATLHIVEERERTEMGMYFIAGRQLHLRVVSSSRAVGTRAAELSALVARLQAGGALPDKLPLHRAAGAVWHPPAGIALELETHMAKRCLLAGTAGGFVEPVAGQTLYTSVASALIAAQTARKALSDPTPGKTLKGFRDEWRKALEKRILRPGTPFRVLLPLVFANHKVMPRLTSSLLLAQEGDD